MKPRTLAAQALGAIEPATKAVVPPVHLATTYLRDPDNQYRAGLVYGRPDNATVRQGERVLAALEAADDALRRLTTLLRTSEVADDEGFFALGAVTIGMYRSLDTLRSRTLDHPVR